MPNSLTRPTGQHDKRELDKVFEGIVKTKFQQCKPLSQQHFNLPAFYGS